jgi:Rieske Fe-S protein
MKRENAPISSTPDGLPQSEQPRWRNDFPIDWPEDHYVARRDFTKFMVLTSLAFTVGQLWIVLQNFFRKRRGDFSMQRLIAVKDIAVGASLVFKYPDEHSSCVLVRRTETAFVAFSQECTHLACAVVPKPEQNCFHCPCHEGYFDLATGQPIAGPPRRALEKISLEFRQGEIYATGVERKTL